MSKTQSAPAPTASPCAPMCRSGPSDFSYCCLTRQRVSHLLISLPVFLILTTVCFQDSHDCRISRFGKEVLNLLMRPYNEEEYKKLWKDIRRRLPSRSRNGRGKSLLSLHKGVNQEIKRAGPDKDKKLNIMRGFFFWLEHLTQQDAFQPWEDEECLQTKPGSS